MLTPGWSLEIVAEEGWKEIGGIKEGDGVYGFEAKGSDRSIKGGIKEGDGVYEFEAKVSDRPTKGGIKEGEGVYEFISSTYIRKMRVCGKKGGIILQRMR
jgi:hypothetical protein